VLAMEGVSMDVCLPETFQKGIRMLRGKYHVIGPEAAVYQRG
jgi:hypothetical protein